MKRITTHEMQSLLARRRDLHVLIDVMEREKEIPPSPWQIGSLRKSLEKLDERIGSLQQVHSIGKASRHL